MRNREKEERQVHPICSLKLTNFEYRARKIINSNYAPHNKIIKNGRHIFTNITVIKTKLFIYSFVLKKCPNLESFIYANSYLNGYFRIGNIFFNSKISSFRDIVTIVLMTSIIILTTG